MQVHDLDVLGFRLLMRKPFDDPDFIYEKDRERSPVILPRSVIERFSKKLREKYYLMKRMSKPHEEIVFIKKTRGKKWSSSSTRAADLGDAPCEHPTGVFLAEVIGILFCWGVLRR